MNLEPILIAAFCLACLLPLAVVRTGVARYAGFAMCAAATVGVAWYATRSIPLVSAPPSDRPIQVLDGGYVSSQACATCHPSQHASWYDSYHRTMTQVASSESIIGDFDDVALHVGDETLQLSRRDEAFWVELRDPDARPGMGRAARVERRIALVTGSHHMQVYWYTTSEPRALAQLPFAYLIAERRWVPVTATFLAPPGRRELHIGKGSWNVSCQKCHATRAQARMDAKGRFDTRVAEFGIACEACHGPAEEHVRLNRNPLRRYGFHLGWTQSSDPTTLVPTQLAEARASEVCGQCHSVYHVPDSELSLWNAFGFSYRPGGELSSARTVVQIDDRRLLSALVRDSPEFIEQHFWSDGMIRVSGREYNGLIESPCYVHGDPARGILECTSCHQMHQPPEDPRTIEAWADDQLEEGMRGNAACESCHATYQGTTALVSHTRHDADSGGSQCYNCHMPYTSYGLLKAIRSHQISSPNVETDIEVGRPNACNQCHLDQTLAWSSHWLERWYGIRSPQLSAEERNVSQAVRLSLSGDAGQRALMAWSMGWPEAQRASGQDWMAPYLGELLADDYDAVRFMAARSLRALPGFENLRYDFLLPADQRVLVVEEVRRRWSLDSAARAPRDTLLIGSTGHVDEGRFEALRGRRDQRPVDLAE